MVCSAALLLHQAVSDEETLETLVTGCWVSTAAAHHPQQQQQHAAGSVVQVTLISWIQVSCYLLSLSFENRVSTWNGGVAYHDPHMLLLVHPSTFTFHAPCELLPAVPPLSTFIWCSWGTGTPEAITPLQLQHTADW